MGHRRAVVEAAAVRAQQTVEWLEAHAFMPEEQLGQWTHVVRSWWRLPRHASPLWLCLHHGPCVAAGPTLASGDRCGNLPAGLWGDAGALGGG